jgi:hypothetical protein
LNGDILSLPVFDFLHNFFNGGHSDLLWRISRSRNSLGRQNLGMRVCMHPSSPKYRHSFVKY